jgi:hypothetical protein
MGNTLKKSPLELSKLLLIAKILTKFTSTPDLQNKEPIIIKEKHSESLP